MSGVRLGLCEVGKWQGAGGMGFGRMEFRAGRGNGFGVRQRDGEWISSWIRWFGVFCDRKVGFWRGKDLVLGYGYERGFWNGDDEMEGIEDE